MKIFKLAIIGLFLGSLSSMALASGSSNDANMAKSGHNKGKMILHKQLMCESCPMASAALNRETAQDIVMKLKDGSATLSESDTKSVVVYLEDRFKL